MKKLIIISDADPRTTIVGGVGIYAAELARNLFKKYDIKFICKKQSMPLFKKVPYKVIFGTKKPVKNNTQYDKSLYFMAKKIITDDNTIIHAQRPDWLFPFIRHKGKKVLTLHGSHYKNLLMKSNWLLRLIYRFVEKKSFKAADVIIAVDHDNLKYFKNQYPQYSSKMIWQPVGVDTEAFRIRNKRLARKIIGVPVTKKIFLSVVRFEKEKNVDLMIKHLKEKEMLLLIGSGREEERLKKLTKGKDVRFLGPKTRDELPTYYSAADAFLLFSTHEGMPTTVLESLSCGTPVIVSPVGELPSIIENSKNGYLIKKNPRPYMTKILNKNEIMKRECRKTALRFDWRKVANKLIKEVYE